MFCNYCGRVIENDSQYCRHCGQSINGINFVGFNNSIRIRVERCEPNFYKENNDRMHLSYIVISKDKLSISIIEDDVSKIDFYDCFAIIALVRCDCYNDFGYHYNSFHNLGFYNDKLEPISKLMIGRYSVEEVKGVNNTPAWGYIRAKYCDENYYFTIYRNTKLIEWD